METALAGALRVDVVPAEAYLRAGDRAAARALLAPIARGSCFGIGAVIARRRAAEMLRTLEP